MLRTIVGPPRSGKSYYVVNELLKYCDYDGISKTWDLKPRHLIITNIDGLKLNTQSLDRLIEESKKKDYVLVKKLPSELPHEYEKRVGLTNLFYAPTWERLCKRYDKIIVVIDEVQSYFPSYDRTIPNSVFFWFEYHGHFGADVFIMSQSAESIHRRLLAVNETFVEVQPQTMRINQNLFKYTQRDSKTAETVGTEFLKADKKVFNAYKSARHDQGVKKQKSYLNFYIAATAVIFLVFGFAMWGFIEAYSTHGRTKDQSDNQPIAKLKTESNGFIKQVSDIGGEADNETIDKTTLARWTLQGISIYDFKKLPDACDINTGYVRCPPYTLPRVAKNLSLNRICWPQAPKTCYIYFPIDDESTEAEPIAENEV